MKLQTALSAFAFAICVAASIINTRAGYTAFGIFQFICGCVVVYRQELGVGVEGKPPTFYVRGLLAILLGIGAMILGVFLILWPHLLRS
ncbi:MULTISPECIES: hypothetical protein [unclassified Caulobacter]|uniref:hypothetical protein n=1 Tax=unclassified Caulobacter TaxID=2648921 RepID=UPI000D3BFFD3|nr:MULTISPECIES: hypothetical protein [unclassified Caulobacter]PTT72178.1 hypothetical protein DBR41_29810 [Pseudomonas sp. HMWF010]